MPLKTTIALGVAGIASAGVFAGNAHVPEEQVKAATTLVRMVAEKSSVEELRHFVGDQKAKGIDIKRIMNLSVPFGMGGALETPLSASILNLDHEHQGVIQFLLEQGAKPNPQFVIDVQSSLQQYEQCQSIVDRLYKEGKSVSPSFKMQAENAEVAKQLLEQMHRDFPSISRLAQARRSPVSSRR
jgi:hypothetical protein